MTIKKLFEELYIGHDIFFEYEDKKYFIEHKIGGLELYQLENAEEGKLIDYLSCKKQSSIDKWFFKQKMLPKNQSILDIFSEIKIIDIKQSNFIWNNSLVILI